MSDRGVFQGPAPTSGGQGGYEYAEHVNREPHGPTYSMVVSEKSAEVKDPQNPHFLGQLLPVAHSRSEEVRSFFDAQNITG
jgi:hypothetical protein